MLDLRISKARHPVSSSVSFSYESTSYMSPYGKICKWSDVCICLVNFHPKAEFLVWSDRLCWSHSSTRAAWHKDVLQPMKSLHCLINPGQAAITDCDYARTIESNCATSNYATSKQSQHQFRSLLACIDTTTKTHKNLSRAGKILRPFHSSLTTLPLRKRPSHWCIHHTGKPHW